MPKMPKPPADAPRAPLSITERVAAATSVADTLEILYAGVTEHRHALEVIAGSSAHLDLGLVTMILASGNLSAIDRLLANPARPADAEARVVSWMLMLLQQEMATDPLDLARVVLRRFGYQRAALLAPGSPANTELLALAMPERGRKRYARRQAVALSTILAHPDMDGPRLTELARALLCLGVLSDTSALYTDPRVDPSVIAELLARPDFDRADLKQRGAFLNCWADRPDLAALPAESRLRLVRLAFEIHRPEVAERLLRAESDPTVWAQLLASATAREQRLLVVQWAAQRRLDLGAGVPAAPPPTPPPAATPGPRRGR